MSEFLNEQQNLVEPPYADLEQRFDEEWELYQAHAKLINQTGINDLESLTPLPNLTVSKDRLHEVETQLEPYLPMKAKEISDQLAQTVERLGFDQFAYEMLKEEHEDKNSVTSKFESLLIRLQIFQDPKCVGYRPLDWPAMKIFQANLGELNDEINQTITGAESPIQSPETEDTPADLLTDYEELGADFETALDLQTRYRLKSDNRTAQINRYSAIAGNLWVVGRAKKLDEMHEEQSSHTPIIRLPKAFYDAYNRQLLDILSQMPPNDFVIDNESEWFHQSQEAARQIDPFKDRKSIEVTGDLEKLPFKLPVSRVRGSLAYDRPGLALASIKRIEFRPFTKEEQDEDTTLGTCHWSEELNGHVISINTTPVKNEYDSYAKEYSDSKPIKKSDKWHLKFLTKDEMNKTLTHEVAHVLHNELPIATLKKWDEVSKSEPVHVTDYVRYRFKHNHPHRFMEDFADSAKLFLEDPVNLNVLAPARYKFMEELFTDIMPSYVKNVKPMQNRKIANQEKKWRSQGLSLATIRAQYLEQEAEKSDTNS